MKYNQSEILNRIGKFRLFFGVSLLFIAPLSCIVPLTPDEVAREASGGYTVVAKLHTSGYAQDVIVVDSCAYMAQGQGGIAIVNIKDPHQPKLMSEILSGIPGYSKGVAYKKDNNGTEFVFSADGPPGEATVNVTDKIHPFVVRPGNDHKPSNNILVCDNILLTVSSADGFWITNIQNVKTPLHIGQPQVPGFLRNLSLTPDSLFLLCAIGEGGMVIYNFSLFDKGKTVPDSSKIWYTFAGRLDLPGMSECIKTIPGTKCACIANGPIGLQIVDYSDTSDIKLTSSIPTGGYPIDVCVVGHTAYLATETAGLQIFDVADIASPQLIGKINLPDTRSVIMNDGYLYAADLQEGLIVIKIP